MFTNLFTQHQSPSATVGRALNTTPAAGYALQPSALPFDWYINRTIQGECIDVLGRFPATSIDCIITDPPYLVHFVDRAGRSFKNDHPNDGQWLLPAFTQMYRVLKDNSYCVSFCSYTRAEWFFWAWREAGFRIEEHLTFIKRYPSSTGHVARHHEQAYVLSKGRPRVHAHIRSVIEFPYSGNTYHPSQKPLEALIPLVTAFSKPQDIVCDPFMGSASTCIAAQRMDRRFIGIELDRTYYASALERLQRISTNEPAGVALYTSDRMPSSAQRTKLPSQT